MFHETENPQETKSVCPCLPARHAKADPGRNFPQIPLSWFSRETAPMGVALQTYLETNFCVKSNNDKSDQTVGICKHYQRKYNLEKIQSLIYSLISNVSTTFSLSRIKNKRKIKCCQFWCY